MVTTSPGLQNLRATDTAAADADAVDATLAASGDAHAFERLYRRHVGRVHTLVGRMLGEDAEDVTQEVLIRAWEKLSTFRGEAAFSTWLYRVAVNVVLNRRAEAGRRRRFLVREPEGSPERPGREVPVGAGIDFETALRALSPGARQVFVLHDVEGYRHDEIAGMLGISAGTSKSQLHYARMALRRHLG